MATASGYYRLEFAALNRKKYARPPADPKVPPKERGILFAKANYFTNTNKGGHVLTVNLPLEREAIKTELQRLDHSITRHNGALGVTFILSHDKQMVFEHRVEATELFIYRLTDLRTRALVGFHDQDKKNPHAHVWILDKDVETGEPYAHLSTNRSTRQDLGFEPNAVTWVRKEWEKAQNEILEKYDYGFTVDCRSNLERGLEKAGQHRGYEAVNDNELAANDNVAETHHIADASKMISDHLPASTAEPEVLEEPPQPEEEELAEPVMEVEGATLADNARLAASACFELRRVRTIQQEIAGVHAQYEQASATLTRAEQGAVSARQREQQLLIASQAARDTYMQEHRGLFGKKGFKVKAFGLEYVSPARKAADAAEAQYQWAKVEAEQAEYARQHAEEAHAHAQHVYAMAKENVEAVQGNEAELQEAAAIMENTINAHAGDLSRETILAMGEDGSLAPEQVKVLIEELGYDQEQSREIEV